MRALRSLVSAVVSLTMVVSGAVVLAFAAASPAAALDNGLALTPPMGFNDWNAFHCNVDEQLIKQTADFFVSSGLKDAGYKYVNIDDCWLEKTRSADGHLVPDPVKFPDGIKGTADYVHSLGLKLGIYEDAGTMTCAKYPGSYGHETTDAQDFADWGVDYLKYDNCNIPAGAGDTQQEYIDRYTKMRDALAATGRPIVFSLCEWGNFQPWTWGADVGNLWRTTGDISDKWSSLKSIIDKNLNLYPAAKPGAWNDPDMLEVGNGGMTDTEYKTHFGMWAMLSAPLLIGTDLRKATPATMSIYLNKEVIAIDQDTLGKQAVPVKNDNGLIVMRKPLANGDTAVALYNETDSAATISTSAKELGLGSVPAYTLRDVWKHSGTETAGAISATVPAHGTTLYRVSSGPGWAQNAPATTLSLQTQGAQGAPFKVASPGQDNPVTGTFTNHGKMPATNVSVAPSAPDGWTVSAPSPRSKNEVGSEESFTSKWTVKPPDDAAPGSYELPATATFWWDENTKKSTVDGTVTVVIPPAAPTGTHYLSDLPWVTATNGYGPVEKDMSNGGNKAGDGATITINGATYAKGLGTNAPGEIDYYVGGKCTQVTTDVGIDDETSSTAANATFQIYADGTKAADSGAMTAADPAKHLTADVTGAQFVRLVADDNGDSNSDHTDWAGTQISCGQEQPVHGTHYLSDLYWDSSTNFWGPVERDMSNGEKGALDGRTITIGGQTYAKGLGTHADSEIDFYVGGTCTQVTTDIGIDDEKTGAGDATWQIYADDTKAAEASATYQDAPKQLTADVTGAKYIRLVTDNNGDSNSDHTDWANTKIICS